MRAFRLVFISIFLLTLAQIGYAEEPGGSEEAHDMSEAIKILKELEGKGGNEAQGERVPTVEEFRKVIENQVSESEEDGSELEQQLEEETRDLRENSEAFLKAVQQIKEFNRQQGQMRQLNDTNRLQEQMRQLQEMTRQQQQMQQTDQMNRQQQQMKQIEDFNRQQQELRRLQELNNLNRRGY